MSYHSYDTGRLDLSEGGKHKKYGTKTSYVLADIYVGDIQCIKTAFAQNTYGVGYQEKLSDMSAAMQAVLGACIFFSGGAVSGVGAAGVHDRTAEK